MSDPRKAEPLIQARNLTKHYEKGQTHALRGVNLAIKAGEFVAIRGPSGSGKSTLLNMIAALDRPDSGEIRVAGQDLTKLRDGASYRAHVVGFIFQLHNLIPTLTAFENVLVPMLELKIKRKASREKAETLLHQVGLNGKADNLPPELSGGERQRVAVARALANDPQIILADEPTGSLDTSNGEQVIELLRKINREHNVTLILVTHDKEVAGIADRVIQIRDGQIVSDK
ncbi:ABC transporter ATP-binding protein [Candidatus Acetothermia bacterium]|nr:ABC transporter ATP-binding protein [Candidatus Acetothermia bacterium]MBI3643112.1 ABC transporter ATP-binding protein [Candidatus Acetothermia bacterium]